MSESKFKNIDFSNVLNMENLVTYQTGQVVSRTLAQNKLLSITLFAFDKNEEMCIRDSVSYSLTNNTLTVKLTDGTEQSFNGLGINYFGGFAQTVLWEGNASSIETYNLSDTIDNYDLLLVKVGNLKTEIIAPAVLKSFRQSTFNPTGQWVATTDATFSGCLLYTSRCV